MSIEETKNNKAVNKFEEQISKPLQFTLPRGYYYDKGNLYYNDPNNEDKPPIWVSSRLEITASTRDKNGNNWGRVLEFEDMDGKRKKWVMPMELLTGRQEALHSTLLNMGLNMSTSTGAKALLGNFISRSKGQSIAVCVDRLGWFDGCYVLPNAVIGDTKGKEILFQSKNPLNLGFDQKGTLEQWKQNISKFGLGNSIINFSISASLTAPFLSHLGLEGGGFHFRGESSKGKTITLYTAGSVWGSHERKKTWRATGNGLEETAQSHNDNLLLLDEMGEMDSRELGRTVYMLANGQGKQRMTETQPKQWRILFLSTGEVGIKSAMLEAGSIARAGQEVRLIDLEAVSGKLGVFDTLLEGYTNSKEQAEHLEAQTREYYGTAGMEMLTRFINSKAHAMEFIKAVKTRFIKEHTPKPSNSQVSRVLNRFGVIAGGGELASHYGITGWEAGEAYQATTNCFNNWLITQGDITHTKEHKQAIDRIRQFIEQHGLSRFDDLDAHSSLTGSTSNRAGIRKMNDGKMFYYFFPSTFKNEVCKGLDYRSVLNALKIDGFLKYQPNRLSHLSPSFEGSRKVSYAVKDTILLQE